MFVSANAGCQTLLKDSLLPCQTKVTKKIGSERPDDISEPEKAGQANTFQELVLYGDGRRCRRCGFSNRLGPEKPTPAFGEVLMVALGGGSAHLDAKPVAEEAHIVHDRPVFR
ncbi:MAG: hypothetical protein QXT77_06640, partial [Candidatus Methanomethylicaceae archaeon]